MVYTNSIRNGKDFMMPFVKAGRPCRDCKSVVCYCHDENQRKPSTTNETKLTTYDTPIANAINSWRSYWRINLRKHDLGPTDDKAWEEYVNGLTMAEVLWNLEIHDDPV